jgi:hypothetical protein
MVLHIPMQAIHAGATIKETRPATIMVRRE